MKREDIPELVPDAMLVELDPEIRRMIRLDDERLLQEDQERVGDPANHPVFGEAWRRFMFFDQWPNLLQSRGFQLSKAEILYNDYYWLRKFSRQQTAVNGYNAGIEQSAFRLLAYPECEADWLLLEKIDQLVEVEDGPEYFPPSYRQFGKPADS